LLWVSLCRPPERTFTLTDNTFHSGAQSEKDIRPTTTFVQRKRNAYRLPLLLFLLTVVTTLIAGSSFYVSYEELLDNPRLITTGIPFACSLLSILLAHEMGHFITSRRYRVDVTLPYFIPAPTLFGTLGAVIKMRSAIRKKTMLLDIGAAGPLAGIAIAVPLVIWGLYKSQVIQVTAGTQSYLFFGDSLLFKLLSYLIVGTVPEGYDIMLSPIAFAGWVGFLVTSLNLMPMGQLDGGHIAYALFGRGQRIVSRVFVGVLVVMGIVYYPGWLVWAALVLIIGVDHPPVSDDDLGLDRTRRVIGWVCFLLFIVTFIPVPVRMDFL
jgi:membrane-associated protease RseP (regulator of RpoE activity)